MVFSFHTKLLLRDRLFLLYARLTSREKLPNKKAKLKAPCAFLLNFFCCKALYSMNVTLIHTYCSKTKQEEATSKLFIVRVVSQTANILMRLHQSKPNHNASGAMHQKLPKLGSWHALFNSDFRGIYFDKITESKEMGIGFSHQGFFNSKPIFFQYQTLRVEVVSPETDQPAIRRIWLRADHAVDGWLSPALWTAERSPTDHAGRHSIAAVWGKLGYISDCLGLRSQSHSVIRSCYSVHAI